MTRGGKKYHKNNARRQKKGEKEKKRDKMTEKEQCSEGGGV
jgi:hypothetical protein